ncbi:MAG: DUF4058 family protein [Gemmataceae bacterium]|nr:DUF4058 family protein [Gemmataceae bacterium]
MPIHDWARVDHGTFHHFHLGWGPAIRRALNNGVLPPGYSAMVEQHADRGIPDLLAPELAVPDAGNGAGPVGSSTGTATAPPKARFVAEFAADPYARLRKTVVIRRGDDRVVALIEIVSPGNKSGRHGPRAFVGKVASAIEHGLHVLVVDLFPPGPRDPGGIHPAIWSEFRDEPYTPPADKPLTVVSYEAGPVTRAYINPAAVGDTLPDAALFLGPGLHVNVPLEATYTGEFGGISHRTRAILSAP